MYCDHDKAMDEKLLSALCYEVETVAGAREAVEVIKTKTIDLVLLEIWMIIETVIILKRLRSSNS